MPSQTSPDNWSPWPQLTLATARGHVAGNDEYIKAIVSEYGADSLKKSWVEVCDRLADITQNIQEKGNKVIPDLTFDEFLSASEERKRELKDVGCFVVRGVVSEEQADQWYRDLKGYVEENKELITGMPADTPFMFNVYHSPVQQAARANPNSLALQRAINNLWHDDTSGPSFADPLSYADGFRIRPANTTFHALPPHIDGGSLSRWADPTYRKVYSPIFSGEPNTFDPYDLSTRQHAQPGLFPGTASQVLRAFQGWTALTSAGPNNGSLLLYPDVKAAISYVLLRPFFDEPERQEDLLDARKWRFNAERAWFPGTWRQLPQIVSPKSHPHLRLEECLVSIPEMRAGDSVWWHADMIHGVDVKHTGTHDSSVLYIAAVPSTEENVKYMKQQVQEFRAGVPPEDFKTSGTDETKFKGYMGEAGVVGDDGRRAAGFNL